MKKEMLINVSQPEECRIAIVEDGRAGRAVHRTGQPGQLRRQHLQGKDRQSGAEHPGGLRRLRRRPQRLPAHQRRRAAVLPPGRLRSRSRCRANDADDRRDRGRRRSDVASAIDGDATPAPGGRPRDQAADPGDLPPRRRSAGAGHQGRASAPKDPRFRPTSAFPAATWC